MYKVCRVTLMCEDVGGIDKFFLLISSECFGRLCGESKKIRKGADRPTKHSSVRGREVYVHVRSFRDDGTGDVGGVELRDRGEKREGRG